MSAEGPIVADRVPVGRLNSVIVTGSVTVMPRIRTLASVTMPTPTGPGVMKRMAFISCIQRGWLSTSASSAHTRSIGASMTIIELIASGAAPADWSARIRSIA
jgi:hypothetical protein